MATFSKSELKYLEHQRLGRVATVGPDGVPHVVPVGFRINQDDGAVEIAGYDMETTRKYRNVRQQPVAALVVDDVLSTSPWQVRGVQIRGRAVATDGDDGASGLYGGPLIRITPDTITSWGIES